LFLQLPLLSIILVIFKATRNSFGASIEHALPLLVFLIFLIKFIVYPPAANYTCVILILI
jgi:sorbitol-specific phosphotransferase system component IIBC